MCGGDSWLPIATGRTPSWGALGEILLTHLCELLVSVVSVYKMLVWRLENIVTSELP